jgi:hypothetical protein
MPTIDWMQQFRSAEVRGRQSVGISQLDLRGVRDNVALQTLYHCAELFVRHPREPNQIMAVSRTE